MQEYADKTADLLNELAESKVDINDMDSILPFLPKIKEIVEQVTTVQLYKENVQRVLDFNTSIEAESAEPKERARRSFWRGLQSSS